MKGGGVPPHPQTPGHVPGSSHLQIFGHSPLLFIFLFLNNTLCQETFGKIHHLPMKAKDAWPFAIRQALLKPGRRTGLVSSDNEWHGAFVFRTWSHKMWPTSFPELTDAIPSETHNRKHSTTTSYNYFIRTYSCFISLYLFKKIEYAHPWELTLHDKQSNMKVHEARLPSQLTMPRTGAPGHAGACVWVSVVRMERRKGLNYLAFENKNGRNFTNRTWRAI